MQGATREVELRYLDPKKQGSSDKESSSSPEEEEDELSSGASSDEDEGPLPSAATEARRFPEPRGSFRHGPRYFWHRAVGLLCRALGCRCRRARPWEDPGVFAEGTLEPHAPLAASRPEPQAGGRSLLLSGEWKFRLFRAPAEALAGGADRPSFDDSAWDTVPVPSQWQLLGYEPPSYTNMLYPFALCPCRRPSFSSVSTGVYRRRFRLPPGFARGGQSVRLLLQGVSSACTVWLDGRELGYHQDSGLPAEFDVGSVLTASGDEEHVLVVRVLKWCDGSYLEDQDTWWLSGIHRDVLLYCLPSENAIEDYFASTAVDAPYGEAADAEVLVHVRLRRLDASELSCAVLDGTQALAETSFEEASPAFGALGAVFGRGSAVATCRLQLRAPAKWSPDRPKLYTLVLTLRRGGEPLQVERWRLGVRDVRVEGGRLRLNGAPLLVNGVNRVEMHAELGKAVTPDIIRDDLLLLKRYNFNAVRTAHCPNCPVFYELCDELGMLVVDEANIETHGFAMWGIMSFLQSDPAWKDAIFERVRAMFCRDKNHTCIVGWSVGNEGGVGPNNAAAVAFLRRADCTRWVQYEGGERHGDATLVMGDGRHPLSDLVCPMYADPEGCLRLASEEERPVVMCEYSHAMGNSNGALHLFYQLFRSEEHPSLQGGFIWDFADQGLKAPKWAQPKASGDWFLSGHWGYGGDFGEESGTQDKWFCCNGLLLPDRTPKPAMVECRYLMQPLRITAEWRPPRALLSVAHTAGACLQGLAVHWTANDARGRVLTRGSAPGGQSPSMSLELELPAAGPGLFLRAWAELAADCAWAARGHVVAEETVMLVAPGPSPPLAPAPAGGKASAEVRPLGGSRWEVRGRTYVAEVSDGDLVKLAGADGQDLLSTEHGRALGHAFWRLPTDNDRGGADVFMPKKLAAALPWGLVSAAGFPPSLAQQWRSAGLRDLEVRVRSTSWQGSSLTVETEHAPKGRPALFTVETAIAFGATSLELAIRVAPDVKSRALCALPTLPRVGLRLVLPPAFSNVTWLGRGPHECYCDRKASAPVNVYSSTVEDMHFPYIVPGECGGRADVQWAALQDASGRGLLAQYSCEQAAPPERLVSGSAGPRPAGSAGAQVSAARWTPEQADGALHDFELPGGEDRPVVLHVDTAHCGIGGVGGATEAVWRFYRQYYVDPKTPEWSYSVVLTPLAPGQLLTACPRAAPARGAAAAR